MTDVLTKIYDEIKIIRIELDLLYQEILHFRKNNENEENIKIIITKYDNLTDKHNNLVDEYEKNVKQKKIDNVEKRRDIPDHLTCITGAIKNVNPLFALGLIQPVGDDGVSPNIPIKRSKWDF
jgi:archaellum component FlaC